MFYSGAARLGLALVLVLSLSACSPLRVLSAISPTPGQGSFTDIVYQSERDLMLDVYAPSQSDAASADTLRPTIVFFFGGAWRSGVRADYAFVASLLTKAGFVVVIPDYRLYPQVVFPAFVEDSAAAVAWTFDNAKQYGGDPQQVYVMGHSAGAHIAALLHYDGRYLEAAEASMRPRGFVGLSGPYDFLPLVSPTMKKLFPEPLRERSQPVNWVEGNEGPALLVHGLKDSRVKPRNSGALEEAILAADGDVEMIIYPERGHVGVLLALSPLFSGLAPVVTDIERFINQHSSTSPD